MDETVLQRLAVLINKRNRNDWDTVGGVTGEEGVGKTDLLIKLGLLIQGFTIEQINKPKKDDLEIMRDFFRNNMLYVHNADEIERVIEKAPQYDFIGIDEGMMLLYKYEHATKRQRELKKYFATCRKGHNNAVFFCMQDFLDFTKFFRNRRIRVWIHVVNRGQAIIMKRSGNPVSSDKWNMDVFSKWYNESSGSINSITALFKSKRYPNYWNKLSWKKLSKKIRNLYDEVRVEIKEQFAEEEEKESQDKWEKRMYIAARFIKENKLVKNFVKVIGVTEQMVYAWAKK